MFKENVKSQVSKKESANPITNRYLPEAIAQSSCKIVRTIKMEPDSQLINLHQDPNRYLYRGPNNAH